MTALPRVTRIQSIVAEHYGITVADLTGPDIRQTVRDARRIAVYLCRVHLDPRPSLLEITKAFRRGEHSNIMRSVRRVTARMAIDAEYRAQIERFAQQLGTAPSGMPDLSLLDGVRKIELDPTWKGRVA